MWYYDPCTSDKGHWTVTEGLSFNSNGMRINPTSDSDLNIEYPSNFSVELEIVEPNSNPTIWTSAIHCGGVGFVGNGTTSYWYKSDGTYRTTNNAPIKTGTIKIVVENGTSTIYYNNTQMQTSTYDSTKKLMLSPPPYNTDHLRIRNIQIKRL